MPIYEYANDKHGIQVQLRQDVADRQDRIILTRRQIPSRVSIGVGAQPPTINDKLADGYKALENAGQLKDDPNYSSVKDIKRAIAEPAV